MTTHRWVAKWLAEEHVGLSHTGLNVYSSIGW